VADEFADLRDSTEDDGASRPAQAGTRAFGYSKDFRTDLPQVVIAMAVTRDGVPLRWWTLSDDTADTAIICTVKDELGEVEPAAAGGGSPTAGSPPRRAGPTSRGVVGHYIHAEKLCHTNTNTEAALARAGWCRTVANNLRVKESPSPPAVWAMVTRECGRHGSSFAITPNKPSRTPMSASTCSLS
jgi:hypothetical protein